MHPNLPVDRRTRSRVGLQRVEDVIVLNHADEDKILNRINPEPRAGNTPPPVRALRSALISLRIFDNRKIQTKDVTRIEPADIFHSCRQLVGAH